VLPFLNQNFIPIADVMGAIFCCCCCRFDVSTWSEERPVPREVLMEQVQGKDALFCMLTDKIDKELLDRAGNT
jgi:glyoxylate/hydroxypyruvate reductase